MSALTDVQCEQPLVKPPPPQRGSAERRACVSLVAGGFLLLAGATLALLLVRTQREVLNVESVQSAHEDQEQREFPGTRQTGGDQHKPFARLSVAMASGTKLPGNSPLPWNVLPSSEWSHDMYNKSECAVIIPVSGLYAINLQITYRSTPHLDHPDSFIVLKNEVKKQLVRYQPGRNVTILTAMDTVPNTDVWMKTIHSQITLFLGEGDKLQVVVSHPNLVDLGGQAQTKSFWELAFLYA
ncbi:uncharacterized protein LOC114800166 [Denticeps clupeoides]|uniref:uncharacterized protein LOC114773291 n=1 Tax=Denticeps clupeoides TaxID=299321 RepID=UPI0010A4282A|nr:uncharacterized protein LOC114773291 [Denticeps clupeoides]XP_028853146.1 uncharacterized protein LOC114800166 [Denticeps clupeoides]